MPAISAIAIGGYEMGVVGEFPPAGLPFWDSSTKGKIRREALPPGGALIPFDSERCTKVRKL